ncbi:transposase [Microbulbifer sp. GL-2]|nr:transposase [Microbulbifer sp. GL-2]
MSRQRRSFSPEFKLEAVRLVVDQGSGQNLYTLASSYNVLASHT